MEANELTRQEWYELCCLVYKLLREADDEKALELLEEHGLSLEDIE